MLQSHVPKWRGRRVRRSTETPTTRTETRELVVRAYGRAMSASIELNHLAAEARAVQRALLVHGWRTEASNEGRRRLCRECRACKHGENRSCGDPLVDFLHDYIHPHHHSRVHHIRGRSEASNDFDMVIAARKALLPLLYVNNHPVVSYSQFERHARPPMG